MKKLITMIGAAAAAFGLYAETVELEQSEIDFTDATPGAFEFGEDEGAGVTLWYLSGEAEGTIEAEETRGNYLKLDAEAPVYRTFAPITENEEIPMDEVAIETAERGGIIADQLVKFSAFEDDPTDLGDAKIAVWVKTVQEEDGDTPATNHLMISTAALSGDDFSTTLTNIDTEVVVDVADWHHLKITAIQAATVDGSAVVPGFVVELDGVVIAKADGLFPAVDGVYTAQGAARIAANELFPSMIAYNATADAGTLKGIAFKGTGAIDDITVAAAPVATSTETTINVTLAQGVTISGVSVGSVTGNAWTFPNGTETGTITLVAPAGKLFSNGLGTIEITVDDLTGDIDLSANTAEDAKAKIGTVLYLTLNDAVKASKTGETVELMANLSGAGIGLWASDQKSITIDLGGYTYTCTSPAVGSAGTVTQGFHIEPGNALVVTNGTITSSGAEVKMLFQNYVDLTLTGVTLDGSNLPGDKRYVLSNNSGAVVLKDCTIIAKEGDFAFDTCKYASYAVPTVEVMGTTVITGNVELTGGNLTLTSGTLVGELVTDDIGAGVITRAETFAADAPAGYEWDDNNRLVEVESTEIKPGQTVTVEAETEEEALSKVTITPVNDEAAKAGQAAVLMGQATETETGKWTVVLVINENAAAFKDPDLALPATLAAVVADTDSAVTVELPADKVTPGLYYSIAVATDLGATFESGERVLATGAGVTLPVNKPEGGKAFFKVSAHMTPSAATQD